MGRKILLLVASLVMLTAPGAFAYTIDLSAGGTHVFDAASGTYWSVVVDSPTGTGQFFPFDRLHANDTESGMNTDAIDVLNNVANSATNKWVYAITYGQIQQTEYLGNSYFDITFDINQAPGSGPLILLNTLRIYKGTTATAALTEPVAGGDVPAQGLTEMFAFTGGALLNYALASSGSGVDDIEVLVPVQGVWNAGDYFYLYTNWGGTTYPSNDGYEEVRTQFGERPPQLPEPSVLVLLGMGLVGLFGFRKFRK